MAITEIFGGFYRINLPISRGGFMSFLDSWLIEDTSRGQTILVETGPASAVPQLLRVLAEKHVTRIDYLIYTHIHLDHAGGAGQFIAKCPDTKVLAPEHGRQHLANPSRLVAGTLTTLGSIFDTYGEPIPVPQENLMSGDIPGLTVIDTPGHAPHHSSYIYEIGGKRVLFTGETAGVWIATDSGEYFARPSTPHKFFYDDAIESLDKLMALKDIDIVCFPHSGYLTDAHVVFETAAKQMRLWLDILSELPSGATPDDAVDALMERDPVLALLSKLPKDIRMRENFSIRQSAVGYLGWIERERDREESF